MPSTGGGILGRLGDRFRGSAGDGKPRYLLVPLASAGVIAILFFLRLVFFQTLELKLLDEHFRLRGRHVPAVPVRIVAIDDASLEKIGRWPWPRATQARLISTVSNAGARVIGLDVILTEPEQSAEQRVADELLQRYQALGVARSGEAALRFERELRDLRERVDPDRTLATAIQQAPVVMAAFFSLEREGQGGSDPSTSLPRFGFIRLRGRGQGSLLLPTAAKVTEPLPPLAAAARKLGHVNILPDRDGTVRRETLAVAYRDKFYASLALQAARVALGVPDDQLVLDLQGAVQVGPVTIPTDVEGRMLLNFAGPEKSFPHYPAADVLSGAVSPATFKDAIVFIGATATGIFDLRVTPFSAVFPGVEIHANTVENILARSFLQRPAWVEVAVFVLILVLPVGLGRILVRLRPLSGGVLAAGLLVGLFGVAQGLFVWAGVWFPVFYPMVAVAGTYIPITVHRALTEERQRLFIKRAFQQYVPEGLVSRILADPSMLRFGGERMVDAVFRNEGTLDKFVGDAVMAVFGAPVPQPDHAVRACRTALAMMGELRDLDRKWRQEGKEPFRMGIGVNTGEVIVGNLGSDQRFDYTVIGDPVNLAARLEGLNKEFPEASGIIISEFTYELAKAEIEARPLGEVKVKGKVKPVTVYELVGLKPS
ncbi:MAG: adenylate/guanylate cyclase domain-containing protein [candidate division NC10 bacterium]|nr:adenylate/guanylate cyclase domain-containing protein [candidate division NC10 bacterium]